jgi:hypothetical protein
VPLPGVDLTRDLRTLAELLSLVEAIFNAPKHELELDWIEWKSTYDLLSGDPQFQLARHALGFANRHPDAAAAVVKGCAYLVVGVEPGRVHGIKPIDSAQLSRAIDAYTGGTSGPRWTPHYVEYQGRTVLVIVVEPPGWGDPIYTLKKPFADRYVDGTIFIRRKGETAMTPNPAEIVMLTERASRRTARIAIDLRWAGGTPEIWAIGATDDEISSWIERERGDLLAHLDTSKTSQPPVATFVQYSRQAENRTADDYKAEVEKYLTRAEEFLRPRLIAQAWLKSPPLEVVLVNLTDKNFSQVKCELLAEGAVYGMVDKDDASDLLAAFPKRPVPFGDKYVDLLAGLTSLTSRSFIPNVPSLPRRYSAHIDNSASARVVFDALDLRPQAEVKLERFTLVAGPTLAGTPVHMPWKATATNADSVATGTLPLAVSGKVQHIDDLADREADTGRLPESS